MMLSEGGAPAPQITVLGAGAPVQAVVVVSVVALLIYALYVIRPAIERWAKQPEPAPPPAPAPSPEPPPCAGCCAFANVDPEQLEELLRHNERLYQTMHEGTAQAALNAPISLIRFTHLKVDEIAEWVKQQKAIAAAQEEVDRKAVARALRGEDTNPGIERKPR